MTQNLTYIPNLSQKNGNYPQSRDTAPDSTKPNRYSSSPSNSDPENSNLYPGHYPMVSFKVVEFILCFSLSYVSSKLYNWSGISSTQSIRLRKYINVQPKKLSVWIVGGQRLKELLVQNDVALRVTFIGGRFISNSIKLWFNCSGCMLLRVTGTCRNCVYDRPILRVKNY